MSKANVPADEVEYSVWRATKFYVPLLIQAFSQSLTYPLVATVVSRGTNGVDDYTAFALGQTVMFMVGALGSGLVTTGMVFGRTVEGLRNFAKMNYAMALFLLGVQLLICTAPLDRFVFCTLLELPDGLWQTARNTLLYCQLMQFAFFLRNIPFVVLFNAHNSMAANLATMFRIVVTAAAAPLFVKAGWTGPYWGCVAITAPVYLEMLLARKFAARYIKALPHAEAPAASVFRQLRFTLPLSIGGVLQAAAPFMVGAFVSRAADAVRMYAIHIVTVGAANPFGFAALRMQAVVVAFRPRPDGERALMRFALMSGAVLALPLLTLGIPEVGRLYFHIVQNLPLESLDFAATAILAFALLPVLQSFRGWTEGVAACRRRPSIIMAGQLTNLLSLVLVLYVLLRRGVQGCYIGVCAILLGICCTLLIENLLVRFSRSGLASEKDGASGRQLQ